jgi:hypothetical protein
MEEATKLYHDAIELLQQADDTPGTEIQAEKLLHDAVEIILSIEPKKKKRKSTDDNQDEERKYFLADIHLLLGRLIEWKNPNLALDEYKNALRILPNIPETNFNVARLIWKQATSIFDMQLAEKRLRDTIKYAEESEEEEDEIYWDNATELLGRLLCQSGTKCRKEALEMLTDLKYEYVFQSHLTSIGNNYDDNDGNNNNGNTADGKKKCDNALNKYAAAFNNVLPVHVYNMMANGFKLGAKFWKENNYGDPRVSSLYS